MHWIKTARLFVIVVVAVLLGACASQEPVIPEEGPGMKAIYRQAMGSSQKKPVFLSDAQALCKQLPVKEDLATCTEKAQAILKKQRSAISANPAQKPLDYVPYTRDATNEVAQIFPRMPNPDLVIYIYPHLATRTRAPIPGYTSVIPLFDRVEYRLPGEIAPLD